MSKFGQNNTKLSNEQVYVIKERYATGKYSYGALAREFGVSSETVGRICRGDSRGKVPNPVREPTPEELAASLAKLNGLLNTTAAETPAAQLIQVTKRLDEFADADEATKEKLRSYIGRDVG